MSWVMVATAAVTAIGTASSAKAQSNASKQNALYAERNQQLSMMQAGAREEAQRRRARYALGSQAAAIAESGVDVNSGSAARSVAESATNAELDALNIRYEGLMQAEGYAAEAANERTRSKYAMNAGYFGAATSLLGGVARGYAARPTTTPDGLFAGGSRDYW